MPRVRALQALEDGAGGTTRLHPGDTIPVANTSPALDLDSLIGGFRPLFRALDPDQVGKGEYLGDPREGDTVATRDDDFRQKGSLP